MTTTTGLAETRAALDLDVEAEIEVLAHAPLQGSWQVPAELVRSLLARGAARVDVEIRRRRSVVSGAGASYGLDELERLAVVLDRRAPAVDRHRAIVELEAAEALPLLWATGAAGGRWRLEVRLPEGGAALSGGPGRPARLEEAPASPVSRAVLEVGGGGLDRRRAIAWLRSVCRFSPVAVHLAGEALATGHRDGAFRAQLAAPMPCDVAIGTEGDAPALWLLRHGVLAARATVPGYPPFHAAVELAGCTAPSASPAEVRAAVQPALPALIEAAVRLMVRAARRLPELAAERRRALTVALLRAATLGLGREEILGLPVLCCEQPPRPVRWLSLAELSNLQPPPAAASEDEQSSEPLAAPLVRLGPEERDLVARLIGTRLRPPPRSAPRGLLGVVRGALRRPTRLWGWLVVAASRSVAEQELTAAEVGLAAAVRRWAGHPRGPVDVEFTAGRGRPRSSGRRLRLPRHGPQVQAAVRASALGQSWLYPTLLAIVPVDWFLDDRLAEEWRRSSVST